jgi:hypothetical protein
LNPPTIFLSGNVAGSPAPALLVGFHFAKFPICCTTFLSVSLFTDPLNVKQTGRADHTEDSYAYATAIISPLRIERDREREAHQKTAKDAEARIAFLEAKLARREAELEECILHTPQCFPLPETSAVMPNPVDGITEHDAVKIMDNTFVKNKVLEAEVKTLADRVGPIMTAMRYD